MAYDTRALIPKTPDGQLRVLAIGRLSKPKATDAETQETIDSSLAVVRKHLAQIYTGPLLLTQLAEQESGLIVDRATILEAEELISSGEVDLVIAEDLSRIYRSARHQHVFVDDCVDAGVRLICVADRLDTADEDWESAMGVASFRHSMPVTDARRRQGRKNIYAFHNGGNVQKLKFGYQKLTREQSSSGEFGPVGLRIAKLPECTPIIKEMRELLMTKVDNRYTYSPLMKWIRENEISVGPYVSTGRWTQRLVKNLLRDPILIGVRRFRTMLFERVRSTGRFKRVLNPHGPETEHYVELAHLTDDEFATMQHVIDEISQRSQNKAGPEHPLYRKPRSDALFPRQHAICSVCNGLMYSYDSDQLKCENAHMRGTDQCWNHVQVNIDTARNKIVSWLATQLDTVSGVRSLIVDCAVEELSAIRTKLRRGRSGRRATIDQLEHEATRIAKAIRAGCELDSILEEAKDIKLQLSKLRGLEQQAEAEELSFHPSCERKDIDQHLPEILLLLASTSHGFANLMREIIPQFEIVPVQAIDSGLVRPRARITLSLSQLSDDSLTGSEVPDVQVELDLFDPPKHFLHMNACLEIKRGNPKLSLKKIATALNKSFQSQSDGSSPAETISYMTVKRCFSVARQMEAEGVCEPYRVLTEMPANASRWKSRNIA